MLDDRDLYTIYLIADTAIEGCNWPALRERLLDICPAEDIDEVWKKLQELIGHDPTGLMEEG